ncbi:MAG: hypothetical protein HFE63_09045 [Clostridiales bacterium]|nr:hypothetical protein [Clostridiales bacterium]
MINVKSFSCEELGITSNELTSRENLRFYNVKSDPFRIYGLYDAKNQSVYHRIPESVAEATSDSVKGLNFETAGGRVRFKTTSRYLAMKVITKSSAKMINMCLIGSSSLDVYMSKNGGRDTFLSLFRPPYDYTTGYDGIIELPDGEKELTVNFPLYSGAVELYLGLDSTSTLDAHSDYKYERPVLFYGSSITQGGCASRAGMAYEAIISRRLDTNYINLGFSGSAKAEDAIVDYMASLDFSVFVCDYDHNAPNPEYLAETHEKMYTKIRTAHPDIPVIFVGKPDFWLRSADPLKRRDVIYNTYNNARLRGEKVLFVDGYSLFAGEMREDCTVDGCHPNDLGMTRMADVIGKAVEFALTEM